MAQENLAAMSAPSTPEHATAGLIQAARGQGMDMPIPVRLLLVSGSSMT